MSFISFVIPCYRSEKTIGNVVKEIREVIKEAGRDDYEIILVNDGSGKPTWDRILELCDDKKIHGINLARNFGQHNALMAGIRETNGELVVCLDDDGQTPACEVYSLIDELESGYDVVYAHYNNKQHSGFRNAGSWLNDRMLVSMINKPNDLPVSSFFVMRRFIADEIMKYEYPYTYMMGLVLRSTNNISAVNVNHRQRTIGKSGYSLKKLLSLWINGFTAFSVKPLRCATYLGFIIAFLGLIYAVYAVINKLTNPLAPLGWTAIIIAIMIIGGMILLVLGIIGEYIGRMYLCMNASPQYVIKEKINL